MNRERDRILRYPHGMMRDASLETTLDFFCAKLGFGEVCRFENEKDRFAPVYPAAPSDREGALSADGKHRSR